MQRASNELVELCIRQLCYDFFGGSPRLHATSKLSKTASKSSFRQPCSLLPGAGGTWSSEEVELPAGSTCDD